MIAMPAVWDGLFMKEPKWRISPVSRCVAPHLTADRKIGRSFSGRSMGQVGPETEDTTFALLRMDSRRARQAGNLMPRLRRASSAARVDVTVCQCPCTPSSTISAAFPDGLWAAVKSTLASRNIIGGIFLLIETLQDGRALRIIQAIFDIPTGDIGVAVSLNLQDGRRT